MKLKFKDDYPLDKIDIQQGEFRQVFERKDQPFEVAAGIGESLLKTTYRYRIDQQGGKIGFEDRFAFEQVEEEPKAVARKK
ncbi:MAG: hypothetical protein AB7U82_33605 [Blastocatellales bacterium]